MPILQALIVPGALIILAGSFVVAWLTGVRRNYLLLLSVSYSVLAVGFCFMFVRWHLHDYVALAIGNGLFILCQVLLGEALLQRRGRTFGIAGNLIAFTVLFGVYLYFLVTSTIEARTIAINTSLFAYMVLVVARFWVHRTDSIHDKMIFWTLVALGVMHTARTVATLFTADIADPSSGIWQFLQMYILLIAMILALEILASHFVESLENLNRLRDQDALSGVLNRAGFDRSVEVVYNLHEASEIALILLDLDDFKTINDSFGHPVGDAVLSAFGNLLREQSRSSDLIGRIGGDEFAILATGISQQGAVSLSERIRARFSEARFDHVPAGFRISCSIGVASLPARLGYEALYRGADQALYQAKRSGRNRVVGEADSRDISAGLEVTKSSIMCEKVTGSTPA